MVAVSGPGIFPAYLGVGYIIGPRLASLNFAGGLLAWGLFAPDPDVLPRPPADRHDLRRRGRRPGRGLERDGHERLEIHHPADRRRRHARRAPASPCTRCGKTWPPAIKRSFSDVKKATGQPQVVSRLEKDLNIKIVLGGLALTFVCMILVYRVFAGAFFPALIAAVVMGVAGFFFAAVSGNLVGTIGSSNNPISGLTLSTLIIAALLMVLVGAAGASGVAAVLGVAAVVCVSSAVAGEMLQDLKVGHILGGTPWKMQIGNIIGIFLAAAVMYFPLMLLHGAYTFGSRELAAPQAGLMAALAKGIVGGEMAWPLVIAGMLMGFAMILLQVKSPMLVSVGMYLPLETTFAIFVGGMIKGLADKAVAKRGFNAAQKARVENVGILIAAGLIAGEGLTGLFKALWKILFLQNAIGFDIPRLFQAPSVLARAASPSSSWAIT